MWSFRPPRSKFGKWIEENGLSQQDISKLSGVSDATVSALASGTTKRPTQLTARKLMRAIKQYDVEASAEDFWG